MGATADKHKKDARIAAQQRGHYLDKFAPVANRYGMWQTTCVKCHRHVLVNLYPAPNEVKCGGDAMAVNCDK